MLIGFIPLGFSEPLRVQLEQGIETDQLQCDNTSHVLVLRDNGNVACITEINAEKMGWEIIETGISLVEYEFPLSLNSVDISQEERYIKYPSTLDVTISNLPKIGGTAELQLTVTNTGSNITIENTSQENLKLYLIIGNNFEFVNQTDVITSEDEHGISKSFDTLATGESVILSATIKAVSEGFSSIRWSALDSYAPFEKIHVGENETLLSADYYKKFPKIQSVTSELVEMCGEEECEPEPLPPDQFVPSENNGITTIKENSEEEYRAFMKNVMNMTDEEVEEMVQRYYPNPEIEPHVGYVSIVISKLPNYGETAFVTVTVDDRRQQNWSGSDTVLIGISLTSQFEFVDLEPTYDSESSSSYYIEMDAIDKDSISFSAIIKVIGEGNGMISGHSDANNRNNTPANIQMIISENEDTVLGAIIEPKIQTQISSTPCEYADDPDRKGEPIPCYDNAPEPPQPDLPTPEELEQAKEEARIRNQDFNTARLIY